MVKLDPQGTMLWEKCLGGSASEWAGGISQATDGSYILAGYSYSNDSMVSGNHGFSDTWVAKLDTTGELLWQQCIGGTDNDDGRAISANAFSGCVVGSSTSSNDGDVLGQHGIEDLLISMLDGTGGIQWHKCVGGTDLELSTSIIATAAGGAVATGCTHSNDGDVFGNHGTEDVWLIEIDLNGMLQWQKCLGGDQWESGNSVEHTSDGGYVVAGYTDSNNGDVTGNHGDRDGWVVKLAPVNAAIQEGTSLLFDHFPDPADTEVLIAIRGISSFAELSLHDLGGRELKRMSMHGTTHLLDVSDLAPGLYVVTVQDGGSRSSRRLVVE